MKFFDNSYFSISDILMTEERIQSEIQQPMPNLGFLCASSKTNDLEKNTKLDIPLWLAESLYKQGLKKRIMLVTCENPKIFKDSYREILHADACAVELNKWNPYYYELGLQLPMMSNSESQRLSEFLLEVFQERFRIIMDWQQDPFSTPAQRSQLTSLEKKLLLEGNNGRKQLLNWLNKGVKQIKTSEVLNNIRKRKRLDVFE